jgi:hypothetical protein
MADLPSDLLDEVGKARVGGGGNYIQHGDYILMIDKWFYQKIQDRCIILECVVIESRKKIVYEGNTKVEQDPNAPGSSCSSTANFDGDAKLSAPANSRAPVLGLYGLKENSVPDEQIKQALAKATSDGQPMHGMLIAVSTFPKEIRSNKGKYITGLEWSCVAKPGTGINSPELAQARAAARRLSADEAVKVTVAQLKAAREAGTIGGLPSTESAATAPTQSSAPASTSASAPATTSAPEIPGLPETPPSLPADPLTGWTVHPKDPTWYYRGKEIKKKDDILAGR